MIPGPKSHRGLKRGYRFEFLSLSIGRTLRRKVPGRSSDPGLDVVRVLAVFLYVLSKFRQDRGVELYKVARY